jgi:predicted outer membrane repeat protein
MEASVVEGGYPANSGADPALDERLVAPEDVGYKPADARFVEAKLKELLRSLRGYQTLRRPEPPAPPDATPPSSSSRLIYVNAAAAAPGDGKAWATAWSSLTAAIEDAARDGAEIRVAAGTYTPSKADRAASFVLRPGVKLLGGYDARDGTRDPARHLTVLSGEIGDPAKTEDNAYHVLVGANGAVVDGFTITGGYADEVGYDGKGGGLINYRRGPQDRPNGPRITGYSTEVRNCIFARNYARDGGAVYNYDRGRPRFVRVVFRDNRAENGGAVVDRVGVQATYEDCEFTGNSAHWRAGAAYFDYGARPTITGTRFHGNFTKGHGGAIYSASRASQLENTVVSLDRCRFENNTASGDGGAAAFDDSSVARVTDCQFVTNRALGHGGAMAATNRSSLEASKLRFAGNSAGSGPADVYREATRMLRLNQ